MDKLQKEFLEDHSKWLNPDTIPKCDPKAMDMMQDMLANNKMGLPGLDISMYSEATRLQVKKHMNISYKEERLSADEYIEFLKRTDLGSQYPKERFEERIQRLVKNVSISLVARDEEGKIVGVLFGLTDYSYWLYVTDLGVDRDYEGQGIRSKLMHTAHELAGGEKDIAVYLIANDNAIPFYEKLGMEKADDVMQYNKIEWTPFTVE